MSYYTPTPTTTANVLRTIEQVAARFGAETEVNVHGVDEVLAAEATPSQVVARVVEESITTTRAGTWLEDAITAHQRAVTVETIRAHVAGQRQRAAGRRAPELLASVAPTLRKKAKSAADTLTRAAVKLPAGLEALDAEAVIAADAAKDRQAAISALDDLQALASVHIGQAPPAGVPAGLGHLLALLDLPPVDVEEIARLTRTTVNPSGERDTVRALGHAAGDGLDLALIDVARGRYDGISISWAETAEALTHRRENARVAFTQRVTDAQPDGGEKVALR